MAASSSIAPPISPTMTTASVPLSLSSASSASRVVVPSIGSPPIPMKADWPSAGARQVETDQRAKAAAARDHADAPGPEYARHEWPGMMPTKHSPGVTRPAVLGPTMRVPCLAAAACIAMTSWARNVFGQNDQQLDARLTPRTRPRPSPSAGGMNMTATSPADLRNRFGCGRKYRHADMRFAGSLRVDAAATTLVP